jgi:hypothetical protein
MIAISEICSVCGSVYLVSEGQTIQAATVIELLQDEMYNISLV